MRQGPLKGGTCVWRFAESGMGPLEIALETWLCFAAPHKHMIVDFVVTSARTNSNVPAVGISLRLLGTLTLGAKRSKLDANIRTS
jgi:hypothetical protein